MTIVDAVRAAPMTTFQKRGVALCLAMMLMDGYDIAVMPFAAPFVSTEWQIGPVMLGYLLSASLFGMAAGSFLLTPLADRIGRRPLTLVSAALVAVGMFGSVLSPDAGWLLITRVLNGVGIGGIAANLSALVAELASERRRGLVMGLYVAGFPIGATLCGLVAGPLVPAFGWRAGFLVGFVITFVIFLVAVRSLPESLEYLITRRPPRALERVNVVLAKLERPPLSELPAPAVAGERAGIRQLINGRKGIRTLLLCGGYALLNCSYFFVTGWIPKIIAMMTNDPSAGVALGTVVNIGGIVGALGFGAAAILLGARRLTISVLAFAAASYFLFSLLTESPFAVEAVVVFAIGAFITAGAAGYYTVGTQVFTVRTRATGMGWMLGVGRLVAIIGPVLVGYLLAAEVTPSALFALFALPALAAGLCVLGVSVSLGRERSSDRGAAEKVDPGSGSPSTAAAG